MLFSHISDTHLGLTQYGLEEREQDIYDSFNEAIDTSIKEGVDFVIFAGDIFHVPNPSGTAIIQMANALRRLKERSIDSFFILGEHDISRIRSTPIPYVYHNLKFSNYIGQGEPLVYKGVLLAGFDKIRKVEMPSHSEKFAHLDKTAQSHKGHKILVMHQGIAEINQYAAELSSTDLPKNFTYYAMGHLHDRSLKQFSHLGGPLAYPGSIEMTTSEGIKEKEKGFYLVDISTKEAVPSWIKLNTRQQFSTNAEFEKLGDVINEIIAKITNCSKKPVVELRVNGAEVQAETIQTHMARLAPHTLYCTWKLAQKLQDSSSVLSERPTSIDEELFKRVSDFFGGDETARFAIRDLLPALSLGKIEDADRLILENYEKFRVRKP